MEIKELVERQRAYFFENHTKDIDFRIAQLKKLKRVLQENESKLDRAIYADIQKSEFDNFVYELSLVFKDINDCIKNVRKWGSKKRIRTNILHFPARSYVIPEPLGVSLVIGAWNYPYQLSFAPVIAAISAGNTVILKPSELPSNTSNIIKEIINSNFDPAYFKVVEGGVDVTTDLLNQHFDKIFFTGSIPVGKIVYAAAAKHLTPVTLELGGKSPAIVLDDCNLPMTIKRLMWAKFLNAGQTCIAPDYIMVHRKIYDEFLELAKKEIEKEHYSVDNGNYVQIINERNINRLANLIDPEKLYYGGQYSIPKRIFEPTILKDVTFSDKVMQEEVFGPILPVIPFDSLEDTINTIKKKPKPLACYIFTSNSKNRDKILKDISFGGGAVNEALMHIANTNLAFGGVGESGIGAYHGEAGFKSFTHYKYILDKRTWFEMNLNITPIRLQK